MTALVHTGVLDYRRAKMEHYGRSMQARLLSVRNLEREILPSLQYAHVLVIKEGGVMIQGEEIHFRATKSKPRRVTQTWWCITEDEPGFDALSRMDARSSTGFHANFDDDDEEDEPPLARP